MGLSGQNNLMWKSNSVAFDNVAFLLEEVFRLQKDAETGANATSTMLADTRPTISIDASLVGYKYIYTKKNMDPVQAITFSTWDTPL